MLAAQRDESITADCCCVRLYSRAGCRFLRTVVDLGRESDPGGKKDRTATSNELNAHGFIQESIMTAPLTLVAVDREGRHRRLSKT